MTNLLPMKLSSKEMGIRKKAAQKFRRRTGGGWLKSRIGSRSVDAEKKEQTISCS